MSIAIVNKLQVTGFTLQAIAVQPPWNMKHVTCNYNNTCFHDNCTQIFKPAETNMDFYLRKRYR
jgi:hypothetical protein